MATSVDTLARILDELAAQWQAGYDQGVQQQEEEVASRVTLALADFFEELDLEMFYRDVRFALENAI